MSRKSCGLFTLCLLAGVGIAPRDAAAGEPNPVIAIRVENANALDGVNLLKAQQLTTEIYEQAGVTLDWTSRHRGVRSIAHHRADDHRHRAGRPCPRGDGRCPKPWRRLARDDGLHLHRPGDVVRGSASGGRTSTSSRAHWPTRSDISSCRPTRMPPTASCAAAGTRRSFRRRRLEFPDSRRNRHGY